MRNTNGLARGVGGLVLMAGTARTASGGEIAPAGRRLAEVLDSLDAENRWPAGVHVEWESGVPGGRPVHGSGKHALGSAFVASAARKLGIYLLRPPEHSQELLANARYDWLADEGRGQGWHQVQEDEETQGLANQGWPVVATYRKHKDDKPGHLAIVRPSEKSWSAVCEEGPQVIQAGGANCDSTSQERGFAGHPNAWGKHEVRFYAHRVEAEGEARPVPRERVRHLRRHRGPGGPGVRPAGSRDCGYRCVAVRVLLVSSNTERISMVTLPLGLGMVAAAARRAGHEVAFLDALAETDPVDAIRRAICDFAPDVTGISVRNIDDQARDAPRLLLAQVLPLVKACRAETSTPIVLGGAGYSIFPAAALRYLGADYGIAGDGEQVFLDLLSRLEAGEDPWGLPGVHVAGRPAPPGPSFSEDLALLPQWDAALDAAAAANPEELWIPVQGRRGCPNDCSYCSTSQIQGRRIRTRPPEDVATHVAALARAGHRLVFFIDNSFNIPEAWALELCAALRSLGSGVSWRCILYPHLVRAELVAAMAGAGCVEVSLGFESGSPPILRALGKRFGPEDVRSASDLLAAHGIRRMGFLLLGGPGETRKTVEESLAFADSLRLDSLRITVGLRIYPGTPLQKRAIQDGVIAADDDLLVPRFYLAPGLEPWIHENVRPGVFPAGPAAASRR